MLFAVLTRVGGTRSAMRWWMLMRGLLLLLRLLLGFALAESLAESFRPWDFALFSAGLSLADDLIVPAKLEDDC